MSIYFVIPPTNRIFESLVVDSFASFVSCLRHPGVFLVRFSVLDLMQFSPAIFMLGITLVKKVIVLSFFFFRSLFK